MSQICQSRLNILPKYKLTIKNLTKTCKLLPKWQKNSKSGHTGLKQERERVYVRPSISMSHTHTHTPTHECRERPITSVKRMCGHKSSETIPRVQQVFASSPEGKKERKKNMIIVTRKKCQMSIKVGHK